MTSRFDARPDAERVRGAARGRWREILPSLGIDARALTGRHGPCPGCGGRDRFRFDDRDRRGTWICSRGGGDPLAGDGFALLRHVHGWKFTSALTEVARVIGIEAGRDVTPARQRPEPEPRQAPRRTLAPEWLNFWNECHAITSGTPAGRYLIGRCCALPENDVRWHPAVWHPGERQRFPAMVALVTDTVTAEPMTLHFTYLAPDGSGKAAINRPRRYLAGHAKRGGVVRLDPDDDVSLGLIVGEGIETCLTWRLEYGPVWATLDSGNLGSFPVLPGIEGLTVLVDRDEAGERAWRDVSARYRAAGFSDPLDLIRVEAPAGNDINDGASAS